MLENTGKGKGGNKRSMCRLCEYVINGNYSRVKAHLLKVPNMGVSSCQKVIVDVLVQLKGDYRRVDLNPNYSGSKRCDSTGGPDTPLSHRSAIIRFVLRTGQRQ